MMVCVDIIFFLRNYIPGAKSCDPGAKKKEPKIRFFRGQISAGFECCQTPVPEYPNRRVPRPGNTP